jgi:uncharacterized membrane protein YvbJ
MNCGARPLAANSFCPACGASTNAQAVICIKCGAGLEAKPEIRNKTGKSKTAAILLAVFLAFWTWLYTYKKDGWKFWVGLGLAIVDIILAIVTFGISLAFTWIIGFGIWIWAIVDTAMKKDQWYNSY